MGSCFLYFRSIGKADGHVTYYFVMGGMGNMPIEVSFEN